MARQPKAGEQEQEPDEVGCLRPAVVAHPVAPVLSKKARRRQAPTTQGEFQSRSETEWVAHPAVSRPPEYF